MKCKALYLFIKSCVRVFYPKILVEGKGNLPNEECIIVGNHCQMNGPIACELYFPIKRYTWCAGEMMHLKEVPAYAFRDFWSKKPKYIKWFYKILSYIIAPLSVCVFNNAETIGVYHDARIISTFKETSAKLCRGDSVVIFPEYEKEYNNIIYDFRDRFIDIAKIHYRKTKKEIKFVPLYIAPKLKKMYIGKPISFCSQNPIEEERQRIKTYLMEEITRIAVNLPKHTVVPYPNLSKKYYKENTYEKAGR